MIKRNLCLLGVSSGGERDSMEFCGVMEVIWILTVMVVVIWIYSYAETQNCIQIYKSQYECSTFLSKKGIKESLHTELLKTTKFQKLMVYPIKKIIC